LNDGARVVALGAKLSQRRLAGALNLLFQSLMKLSFSSTPALNHEPWCVLENWLHHAVNAIRLRCADGFRTAMSKKMPSAT
jgi:hypothetical protein